jgi:diguanylate cyclase
MMGNMIYTAVAAAFGGAGIALVSVLALARVRIRRTRKTAAQRKVEERLAAEVLRSLSCLTGRVAGDVLSHSRQVAEVSARLANDESGAAVVKDAVRRLLKANQQVQEKLSQTEDQLRCQARKLEAQAAAARTDPLTLLGNRRALEEEFHRLLGEFHEHGRCFSLVIADLDHFKEVNDVHGHAAGDEVLRGLAKVLRHGPNENALVARVGGEEFAVLTQDAPLAEACAAAEVTREKVKTSRFPFQGNNLSVTASFGVTEMRKGEDAGTIFHRANQALYMAKQSGCDTVCWDDGERSGKGLPAAAAIEVPATTAQTQPAGAQRGISSAAQRGMSSAAPPGVSRPAAEPSRECYGLPNRTMFCNSVRVRVCEWKRDGPPFSILLLKIHPQGKSEAEGPRSVPAEVLQATATLIQSAVRDLDLVGYYAPACFSLLVPGVDPLNSSDITRRLEEQLSHLPTNVGGTPPMDLHVGTAVVTAGDDTVSLLKRAETDLRVLARRRNRAANGP